MFKFFWLSHNFFFPICSNQDWNIHTLWLVDTSLKSLWIYKFPTTSFYFFIVYLLEEQVVCLVKFPIVWISMITFPGCCLTCFLSPCKLVDQKAHSHSGLIFLARILQRWWVCCTSLRGLVMSVCLSFCDLSSHWWSLPRSMVSLEVETWAYSKSITLSSLMSWNISIKR